MAPGEIRRDALAFSTKMPPSHIWTGAGCLESVTQGTRLPVRVWARGGTHGRLGYVFIRAGIVSGGCLGVSVMNPARAAFPKVRPGPAVSLPVGGIWGQEGACILSCSHTQTGRVVHGSGCMLGTVALACGVVWTPSASVSLPAQLGGVPWLGAGGGGEAPCGQQEALPRLWERSRAGAHHPVGVLPWGSMS